MHFVAFHVEPSAAAAAKITESCSAFHADTDYRSLLAILFQSVELFHAGARKAVLTDERTPLDSLPRSVSLRRCKVDPDRVMYSRLAAQIDYIRSQNDDSAVAFLDSDMIVNEDLSQLATEEFDIALTYRRNPEMPLNGGFILVKGGSRGTGLRFLERVRSIYAEQFSTAQHWWGDQRALIAAVGQERFARRASDCLTIDGVRIRLLPCDKYNFSPTDCIRSITKELRGKSILHFKGERKRLMPLYWNAHLAPCQTTAIPSPLDRFCRQQSLRFRDYAERAVRLAQSSARLPSEFAGRIASTVRRKAG